MPGVETVGLGQAPGGPREVADPTRIQHGHGQAGVVEFDGQGHFVAAGGLHGDARDGVRGEGLAQGLSAGEIVGKVMSTAFGQQMDVESFLADIDADDERGGTHQVSLPCQCELVAVRPRLLRLFGLGPM